jgi:hypothetical protein
MSPGKPLRPRRGGGWVAWGGDACVALGGGGRRSHDQDEGDASVPPPTSTTPAPTGPKPPPRRHHKIPTLESSAPAPTNVTLRLQKNLPV